MEKQFSQVTVDTKANVYFDGKVVSHSLHFADGTKKTLGLIYPGVYHFNTDAAELMEIVAGTCQVKLADANDWKSYAAGTSFNVAAKSSFDIKVDQGIAEYICSFLSN